MFDTVEIPLWLLVTIVLFAAVTALSHVFIPPVRWFLRRRMEHVVARLNDRLERPIHPFKLARRHDTIQRLIYDPGVVAAVTEHARLTGVREDVAFDRARRYAREIVPAFSATAYFSVAIRAARWLSTFLFDVRLVSPGLDARPAPEDTVVFVMNHRSNMDYVLVTWLSAERSALSYAVGEWARIWPLSVLVRAMGAYFIRRRSRDALYRKVLARYVQMATRAGVTQAIFPEGGLSLDGRTAPARLGLLSYIVDDFDPAAERDVVFVPVSLGYDQVLEDRILIEAGADGRRRFRGSFLTGTAFVSRWAWRRVTRQVRRFGIAAVAYGVPLSLRSMGPGATAEEVAQVLMSRIAGGIPVLPIPLIADALRRIGGSGDVAGLRSCVAARMAELQVGGAPLCLPEGDFVAAGLRRMALRGMVRLDGGAVTTRAPDLVAFYAAALPPDGDGGAGRDRPMAP